MQLSALGLSILHTLPLDIKYCPPENRRAEKILKNVLEKEIVGLLKKAYLL